MQVAASFTEPPVSTSSRVIGTVLAVVVCNAVGIAGAVFTSTDTTWYAGLVKPDFQPPGWVFGPVWTLLYTMMGVALYRVFERRQRDGARRGLWLFAGQLILNGIWSPVFFAAQAIVPALFVILGLAAVLALTVREFLKVDRLAGALLVPYLVWVVFATILNGALVALN